MIVVKTNDGVKKVQGVPDYYKVYASLWKKYMITGCPDMKALAYHYARVAAEMGQVVIDDIDDRTDEITLT